MNHNKELEVLIRARYPILYVISWEERRVQQALAEIAKTLGRNLHVWTMTEGLKPPLSTNASVKSTNIPLELEVLAQIRESTEGKIFMLKDFHPYMKTGQNSNATVVRMLRDLGDRLRGTAQSVIIVGPTLNLPTELEKDVTVIEFPLPNRTDIEAKLNDVIETMKASPQVDTHLEPDDRENIIKSAQGLTLDEVESCLARSLVEHKKFSVEVMLEEKKQIIRKGGLLDYYPADTSLSEVGGHEILIDWLKKRRSAFTDKARQFGIPAPKGVLLLGVQGCGKSLIAKSIAANWDLPLLKLDMGRIFGSYVGQSEENMRRAISIAESVAPCILWMDELEKGLGGTTGASGDSGATQRVFATFLSWMQEKTKPVFMVATANDVSRLPPELLRKGRFDEIFFIDLPESAEREHIFSIHLKKRKRDPATFDLTALAKETHGFSGAEIEQVVIASLYSAFDAGRELSQEDLILEATTQVPLSQTMREEIAELRAWAGQRARPSSAREET